MDHYRAQINHAKSTYLECKFCPHHFKPRRKLRWVGRMLKRSARQQERKERDGS